MSKTLPSDWKKAKLGDIADVEFSSVDKKTVEGELPVLLCNYHDIVGNHRIQSKIDFMPATATVKEVDKWTLHQDDVVFTKDAEVGRISLIEENIPNLVCGYHLGRARPRKKFVTGPFLAELLKTPAVQRQFSRLKTGLTISGIKLGDAKSLQVLLPPLYEQIRIATILDSIDKAIEQTENVITKTEQLRNASLHELLTRGLPDHHTEWKKVPGLGTIPATWQVVRLGDIVDINRVNWNPAEGGSIQYIDIASVVETGVIAQPTELVASDAPSRARRSVQFGDILVSTVRPSLRGFARVDLDSNNLVSSTGFAVLSSENYLDGSFVYYNVMTDRFRCYLEKATTGQAYPAVSPSDVGSYLLARPSCLNEISIIVNVLDDIEYLSRLYKTERKQLERVKLSLAVSLLNGYIGEE